MQSGRRRGNRPFVQGKDSLIAFAVAGSQFVVTLALNVRRKRHTSIFFKTLEKRRTAAVKSQKDFPAVTLFDHFGEKVIGKVDKAVLFQPLAGFGEGKPLVIRGPYMQGDFNFHLAAQPVEPRRNDFGIIADQQVAGLEKVRQIAHHAVGKAVVGQVEQTRGIARAGRAVRDKALRQFKIKKVYFHESRLLVISYWLLARLVVLKAG